MPAWLPSISCELAFHAAGTVEMRRAWPRCRFASLICLLMCQLTAQDCQFCQLPPSWNLSTYLCSYCVCEVALRLRYTTLALLRSHAPRSRPSVSDACRVTSRSNEPSSSPFQSYADVSMSLILATVSTVRLASCSS